VVFGAGVTEENRQQRIDAIMPTFIETVRYWQEKSGVSPLATALIGFSQGAIMSLESIKAAPDLASRVIAFNGRYATLPETATTATTIHLIHGVKIGLSTWRGRCRPGGVTAGGRRRDLDIVDDLGHAIDDRSMQFALDRLRYTVPKHYFDEALSGSTPKG
jgi:phospholipase/carboxylesterase